MLVQSVLQHMSVVLPANSDAFMVSRIANACAEHVAAYACGPTCKHSCKQSCKSLSVDSPAES